MGITRRLLILLGVVLWLGVGAVFAQQDETPAEKQYREDYDRFQTIAAIKDPLQRADEFVKFLKDRPKSQIENYVLQHYLQILQELDTQQKWDALSQKAEGLVKVRPKVGEVYYLLGMALKQQNKADEAMEALAKCYVLRCPVSDKARQGLEVLYRGTHNGKTAGMDELIAKARKEILD